MDPLANVGAWGSCQLRILAYHRSCRRGVRGEEEAEDVEVGICALSIITKLSPSSSGRVVLVISAVAHIPMTEPKKKKKTHCNDSRCILTVHRG
jgi:hypothetical protein